LSGHQDLVLDVLGKPLSPLFPADTTLAKALADLAVTGQRTYRSFQQLAPQQADLEPLVISELRAFFPSHQPVTSDVSVAVDLTLQRAYQVAWALRGPTPHRRTQRNGLGWIAVDGEDDPPHRPVNVPSANHFQGNMTVQVGAIPVVTRYVVASRSITDNNPVHISSIPPDRSLPLIVGDIILFIPGHSSSAEEPEALIGPLLDEAAGRGRPLTLISMDLPSNGYASMIEHTTIAGGALPAWNTGYQLLDFLENFIVAFVDGLEAQQPGIKRQIIGVIGGSLGGNLTLRLGRRDPVAYPWLHSLVSWSPASSWQSWERAVAAYPVRRGRYYDLKRNAARGAFGPKKFMLDEEVEEPYDKSSLNHLFHGRAPTGDAIGRVEQAEFWYSTYYECADTAKAGSHRMLYEIYNPRFRRWHWRIAYEQLIYSHHDSDNPSTSIDPDPRNDPAAGPARYSQIKSRLLLAAGVEDNMDPVRIYSETRELAALMTMVTGTTLYVRETGHSIDTERPKFFSKRILDFLFVNPSPPFPYFLTVAANF
jgi:pimeloyl-ACP methyl ester carboxylesterase